MRVFFLLLIHCMCQRKPARVAEFTNTSCQIGRINKNASQEVGLIKDKNPI